jgi:hypothetical protein
MPKLSQKEITLILVLVPAAILFAFYGVGALDSWLLDEIKKRNEAEHLRYKKVTWVLPPNPDTVSGIPS